MISYRNYRNWIWVTLTVTMLSPMALCSAQTATNNAISSFPPGIFTDDALVVGELSLQDFDAAALAKIFEPASPGGNGTTMVDSIQPFLEMLRAAGVRKIYLTVTGRSLLQGGLSIVVPCNNVDQVAGLAEGVVKSPQFNMPYAVHKLRDRVVVCPESVAELFTGEETAASDRQDLFAGLEAVKEFPSRIIISLPEHLQHDVAAVLPDSLGPQIPIPFSPRDMMKNMRTIAIGMKLPAQGNLTMKMLAVDDSSASALENQIKQLLGMIPPGLLPFQINRQQQVVALNIDMDASLMRIAPVLAQGMERRVGGVASANMLKQFAMAMHNYHEAFNHFPGKALVNAKQQRLLSWRVLVLPYLGQQALYDQFHLDEPWDSPHNRSLIAQMPEIYQIASEDIGEGMTRYRLPVFPGGIWAGENGPRSIRDITDGTSNTVMIALAPKESAIEWTRPDDWE